MVLKQIYNHLFLSSLFSLCVGIQATKAALPWQHKGTTPFLKEIVIGRCQEYLQISRINRIPAFTINVDCNRLWDRFRSAWAGKDNCAVKESDYDEFFSLVHNDKSVKDMVSQSSHFTRTPLLFY